MPKLNLEKNEFVIRSTGYSYDILLRDRKTGEEEYIAMEVEELEWLKALAGEFLSEAVPR